MRTLLRYLPVQGDDPRLVRTDAFVLEANAQLIARRFSDWTFSIVAPDGVAHWDGAELAFFRRS